MVQEDTMSNPRIWNRREFDVTPAGFLTVLRPTRWFSAARLPGGFRYLVGPSKRTKPEQTLPEHEDPGHAGNLETAIPLQIMPPATRDRDPMRAISVVLTAAAITFALLSWITKP